MKNENLIKLKLMDKYKEDGCWFRMYDLIWKDRDSDYVYIAKYNNFAKAEWHETTNHGFDGDKVAAVRKNKWISIKDLY